LLKRGGNVYTEIVPDCSAATLQSITRGKTNIDSVIHFDGWRGYNGLVDFGYKKHLRVDHGTNEFVRGKSHINGIKSFWGYAKTRLSKFRGMNKDMFELHLKECEFRFNHRGKNMYNILLQELRKNPLN
jgi:transposase-like protein